MKLLKAGFLIAFAFAALGMLHRDLTVETYRLAEFLHIDPENRFMEFVLRKVGGYNDTTLKHVSEFIFAYAAIYLIELIVGELTPLLLNSALKLLPVSFESIPVHEALLLHLIWSPQVTTTRGKCLAIIKVPMRLRDARSESAIAAVQSIGLKPLLDSRRHQLSLS
jgi:hypothetical protein